MKAAALALPQGTLHSCFETDTSCFVCLITFLNFFVFVIVIVLVSFACLLACLLACSLVCCWCLIPADHQLYV